MRRVVLFLATAAMFALAACATPADNAGSGSAAVTVEFEGRVSQVASSGDTGGWVVDVTGEGYLPITVDGIPPVMCRGVEIEVPGELDLPSDTHGRFAALAQYSADHDLSFRVVSFLR